MILPLVFSLIVIVVWVGHEVIAGKRREAEFKNRFPTISDEEFMARCLPGTDPAVALKVRKIVAEQLGVEYERIYPSTRFGEDLGVD